MLISIYLIIWYNKQARFLYYLSYCDGICLNLNLKTVQQTSHKRKIYIYFRFFESSKGTAFFLLYKIIKHMDINLTYHV